MIFMASLLQMLAPMTLVSNICFQSFVFPNKSLYFQTPALLMSTSTDFNVFFTQSKASKMFSSEHKSTLR
ncbi:hypothetical protein FWK35_00028104 [Aphis craccivora]|uniref:Secreted protein n=1 Tax=Aphis craccivora TaxID=307492 RepID=A0A6G0X096_APHCR|nr:hypothetical protein FWK35_00028104 [Aphis craccivora]